MEKVYYNIEAQGMLIRNARKKLGISQKDMAEYLGVSQSTIGMWETGKRRVPAKNIKTVCDKLEIPYQLFIGDTKIEQKLDYISLSAKTIYERLNKHGKIQTPERFDGEFKIYLNILTKEFLNNGYKLVVKKI